VTIKMSGHPPFGAQIILNGHEFVARQAAAAGIAFSKVGNCFTAVADPAGLARIADALSRNAAVGRLGQVCQRWIYTACLCFGLDLDEQQRSGFAYGFAVYQLEYSRNLIFADGARMQRVFDTVVDRTRSRLDVPKIRTIFGSAQRPRRTRKQSSMIEAAIETPTFDLTVFKLHFGRGERLSCAEPDALGPPSHKSSLVAVACHRFDTYCSGSDSRKRASCVAVAAGSSMCGQWLEASRWKVVAAGKRGITPLLNISEVMAVSPLPDKMNVGPV
jgi:hypothetical protein